MPIDFSTWLPNKSQLEKHDEFVMDFIAAEFAGLRGFEDPDDNMPPQVLWQSPQRRFIDYLTLKEVGNERYRLPRITLRRQGGWDLDRTRMNSNDVPFVSQDANGDWIDSIYPATVDLNYQVDFLTHYIRQMNWWEEKAALLFHAPGDLHYEKITIGGPWADKYIRFHLTGWQDNSDIEPGDKDDRIIRATASLKIATCIFPELGTDPKGYHDAQFFTRVPRIERVSVEVFVDNPLEKIASLAVGG